MKIIEFEQLPQWSVLAHRLINDVPLVVSRRDFQSTSQEYNLGIYGQLLQYFERSGSQTTMESLRAFHEQMNRDAERRACEQFGVEFHEHQQCVSLGELLLVMPRKIAKLLHRSWLIGEVIEAVGDCRSIVDLACGYGYFLTQVARERPDLDYIGADGSTNATRLGTLINRDQSNISFVNFDFHSPPSYDFIADTPEPVLVMTVSAIEQLPTAASLLAGLDRHADRIGQVVHMEPIYQPRNSSPLGGLRRRYIENQQYNRDLVTLIEAHENKRIVRTELDQIGLNPLLPSSLIRWQCNR